MWHHQKLFKRKAWHILTAHWASCRMKALGANLIGVKQSPWDPQQAQSLDELFTERRQWPQLQEAAGKADIIALTCTVTDATRGMINEAFLGACQKGVIIINVARGGPNSHVSENLSTLSPTPSPSQFATGCILHSTFCKGVLSRSLNYQMNKYLLSRCVARRGSLGL